MIKNLMILFLLSTPMITSAQDCPCCTEDHRAFDFWLGEWTVYDTSENIIGYSSIEMLEDQCLISEHWRSSKKSSGRSYNYYNASDSTWNQVWVDNQGGNLVLKGRGSHGQMILDSELVPGKKVDYYKNRITWTLEEDQSVSQLWEMVSEKDELLQVVFKGIYRKD